MTTSSSALAHSAGSVAGGLSSPRRLGIDSEGAICAFTAGCHYYGSLTCRHNPYKVLCVRRTAKSVWFSHYIPPLNWRDGRFEIGPSCGLPRRSKVKWFKNTEIASHDGWTIWADGSGKDGG
jgi:hypothetical protein